MKTIINYPEADHAVTQRSVRWVVASLGLMSFGIGWLGIFVPGLPTTVFWIIAAWCAGKSCPALQRWLYARPRVGPVIELYNERHMMTRRSKNRAVAGMWSGMGLSALFLLYVGGPIWVVGMIIACGIGVTWYILNGVTTAPSSTD